MVLGNAVARIKYGKLIEDGNFQEHTDEYREIIGEMEDVDVEIQQWYDPVPTSGMLTPTEMNTTDETAENLDGEKAWEFTDQTLQEMTDGKGLEDIPFYFQHRTRRNQDHIHLGTTTYSILGSRKDYHITLTAKTPEKLV